MDRALYPAPTHDHDLHLGSKLRFTIVISIRLSSSWLKALDQSDLKINFFMKPHIEPIHIKKYAGKRVGIDAYSRLHKGVSITPSTAHQLIQILRSENIEFVVSPCEADAQLAYLSSLEAEKGGIVAVTSKDSDLLAYGCPTVVFKMDRYGNGEEIVQNKLSHRHVRLAGCAFLPSVPGIGITKAYSLVSKYRNLDRVNIWVQRLKLLIELYTKTRISTDDAHIFSEDHKLMFGLLFSLKSLTAKMDPTRKQLQQHVRVHAMEAVMACWEIEQSLQSLTGVSPGEGTGATMSDDDDDQVDSDTNLFDGSLEGADILGFGPLVPTESERSLMERVRQELKHELKQGYKEKIVDIREEILRKRRAGKLPGDTTSMLKAWWQSHSKWPYPTEEDKARLVQETGLQLKQINNWFINQRKRNWHSNSSTSTVLKSKRKSGDRFM
ncbi:unnamed protein product [Camellia sinensis]